MLYPKIESPFKRHTQGDLRNKLDVGNWVREDVRQLRDLNWEWTEKVNGTNVRVIWDGYKVRFGGRTYDAQMPIKLLDVLTKMFSEELMEDQFGKTPAILFGEGYGPGIQNGGNYRQDLSFVLFDVNVQDWWLLRENIVAVASGLGIDVVPTLGCFTIQQAIDLVTEGHASEWGHNFIAEGLVGKPPMGLLGRDGSRLMVKIKTKDFRS